jgi:hypothetical protein
MYFKNSKKNDFFWINLPICFVDVKANPRLQQGMTIFFHERSNKNKWYRVSSLIQLFDFFKTLVKGQN